MSVTDAVIHGCSTEYKDGHSHNGFSTKQKWQLALEKAYLDGHKNGSPVSDSVVETNIEESGSHGNLPEEQHEVGTRNEHEYYKTIKVYENSAYQAISQVFYQRDTKLQNNGYEKNVPTLAVADVGGYAQRSRVVDALTVRSQISPVKYELCDKQFESELLRLFKTDDGVQLSVRTRVLDSESVLRLSRVIRRLLDEKGESLVCVSVNGKRLWNAGSDLVGDSVEQSDVELKLNEIY